jgi:ribosome recycling factor
VRIPIPPLTEERRKELVKKVAHMAEEERTHVRLVRRDANDHLKKLLKDKEISEDDEKRALEQIQKLTDKTIQTIDEAVKHKEKDLLEV